MRRSGDHEPTRRMPRSVDEPGSARTRRLHAEPPTPATERIEPTRRFRAPGHPLDDAEPTHRLDGRGVDDSAPVSGAPVSGVPVSPAGSMRGRASVPAQRARTRDDEYDTLAEPRPRSPRVPWFGPGSRLGGSRRGFELSIAGGLFAFVGWAAWALDNQSGSFGVQAAFFGVVIAVAAGVFLAARLAGYYVYERMLRRRRGSARLSHLLTGAYLVIAGISYFQQVTVISDGLDWLQSLL